MTKKFIKRFTQATALSLLMTPLAKSHFPFTAFKNITNNFKEGMQHYSPTYGEVFYKEYLYNTINYNTFKSYFDNESVHKYARDHSGDDVWQLAKYFFPSVTGEVNTTSQANTNFSRFVNDPKTIACLLNHAFAVKKAHQENKDKIQDIKDKKLKEVLEKQQISKINKGFANTINKLNENCNNSVKKTLTFDSATDEKKYTDEITKKITVSITKSIQNEVDLGYPEHTTLNIINAFFTDKFDKPEDFDTLFKNLSDEIVDKAKLAQYTNHKLTINDLEDIKNRIITQPNDVTIDDVYALKNAKQFFQVTPYAEDQPPVSNGKARVYKNIAQYDKNQSMADIYQQEKRAVSYSDCVEVTIRHLFNLALYDNNGGNFRLDELKKINTPYAQRLVELYENHLSSDNANSDDTELRSFMSMILGDLNADATEKHDQIIYAKGTYELEPGYINTLRVLNKLLDLKLAPLPTTGDDIKLWIQEGYNKFFNTLNPSRTATFDFNELETNEIKSGIIDYGGQSIISVEDDNQSLFTFNFNVNLNEHSYLNTIKTQISNVNFNMSDFEEVLKSHLAKHPNLDEMTRSYMGDMNTSFFHKVFFESIRTNEQRMSKLQALMYNFDQYKHNESDKKHVLGFIEHLLENLVWNDQHTINSTINPINNFLCYVDQNLLDDRDVIRNLFMKYTKYFNAFLDFQHFQENTDLLSNKSLVIQANKIGTNLNDLKNIMLLVNTSSLKISDSDVETIDLTNKNFKFIKLNNLSRLTKAILNANIIDNLDINNVPFLEKLEVYSNQIKNFDIKHPKNLKTLSLINIVQKNIDINDFTNLEEMNLVTSTANATVSIQNSNLLQSIEISNRKEHFIKRMKLKNLDSLNNLDIRTSHIDHLILDNVNPKVFSYLWIRNLKKITIKNLDLNEIPRFKEAFNLKKIIFKGKFPNLKKVDLSNLKDVVVEGLDEIVTPGKIDVIMLKSTSNIIEDYQENHLIFKNSSVNDADINKFIIERGNLGEKLSLINLKNLKELKPDILQRLKFFKKINIENTKIQEITWGDKLTIQSLKMSDNEDLRKFELSRTKLNKLSLVNLPKLAEFKLIRNENLDTIKLKNLPGVKKLGTFGLTNGTKPKKITVNNVGLEVFNKQFFKIRCEYMTLKNLNHLETLDLSECLSLKILKIGGTFNRLKTVDFTGLKNTKITGLEYIEKIEGIKIIGLTPEMRASHKKTASQYEDLGQQI